MMQFTKVLSAEECAEEAQKQLNASPPDQGTMLAGIGWALLSIAQTRAEEGSGV